MIIIFGSIILIILVILVILAINKHIDYKIPILFMFFVLVSSPFIHLDKNIVQLEKFTNSSLDIYYLNQKKTKASECNECAGICDDEEQSNNKNENYMPLLDPVKLNIEKKKLKSIMIEGLIVRKEEFDCTINGQTFDNEEPLNVIQVDIEGKIKHSVLKNSLEIDKVFNTTKDNTYIILITSGKLRVKKPEYNLDINSNSDNSTSINIFFKTNDDYNTVLKKENDFGLSYLYGYKLFNSGDFEMIDLQGKIYDNPIKLESNKRYVYKNSLISSYNTKTKQYLVFSNENNQSFVYLSGNTDSIELYDYKKTDGREIVDITNINTHTPQQWDIEFVLANFGGNNCYIKTSSYPTFYLEVVDNEIKMNMYKGGANQYWKLNKSNDKNLFTIQHSKTGMFLSYQMSDGYLYKNNGSVYLTQEGMEWNIEANTIIDKSVITNENDWIEITSPDDFVNEGNSIFELKGKVNGKMINLSSNGRTTWDKKFSPIWNGNYIYYGTIANSNNYLAIKLDNYGNGTIQDPYLGITIDVVNIGADILYGRIKKGSLNGIDLRNYSAILEMVPEKYEYKGLKESYPVKIRYLLIGENKIYSLGSSNLDNLDSYATKKVGDIVIYSNLVESKGTQVDQKLARPKLN